VCEFAKPARSHPAASRGSKNPSGRFLKVSESKISRYSDGYDESRTRQMASSLGAIVGLE
jgi:hypothetical protein